LFLILKHWIANSIICWKCPEFIVTVGGYVV